METEIQTQHPDEALGQPENTNTVQEEVLGQPPIAPEADVAEEQEDPDAWRNIRLGTTSSEIYEQLSQLSERDPEFKRTLGALAGRGTSARLRQENIELAAQLEAEKEARRRVELEAGNATWGRMNQQQVANAIAQNPVNAQKWADYNRLRQEYSQPRQQSPEWLRNMVVSAQEFADEVGHTLPAEYEAQLREAVTSEEFYKKYLNEPHRMMADLKETVAQIRGGSNNAPIQAGTTPRPPAPGNSGTGSRTVLAGNPAIGSRTPDQTPPRRTSGGSTRYSRADIQNMPQAQYEELKKLHGVETVQGLVDAGVVIR